MKEMDYMDDSWESALLAMGFQPKRKTIKQMVMFDDMDSDEKKRIFAEIIIDKDKRMFKFVANTRVSLVTFAKVLAGNKQIRRFGIRGKKRRLCRIISKNAETFYFRTKINTGEFEELNWEPVIKIIFDRKDNRYYVKETGWISLDEVSRIVCMNIEEPAYDYRNLKMVINDLYKKYNFEYVRFIGEESWR